MAGHTDTTEWCPTAIILEKIRQDGFDTYGLKNLKKMLKCIVKHEVQIGDAAYYCRKDLEKIWKKCRDDPFVDDFGMKAIQETHAECHKCEEQEASADKQGPIDRIRQIIEQTESNHKALLQSKYDLGLVALMKHRVDTLKEIDQCREAYHQGWRLVLSQKEQDRELTPRSEENWNKQETTDELNAKLDKLRTDYKKYLKMEENQRPFFLKLCRTTKTTLMRHELELFLQKKEAYILAADWLEKTTLARSRGGPENPMVVFLRKQAKLMNAKQFVDGWLRINCEEISIPHYEEYDSVKDDVARYPPADKRQLSPIISSSQDYGPVGGDMTQSSPPDRRLPSPITSSPPTNPTETGSASVKSSSNPDIPAATDQILMEAKFENMPSESQSLHSGIQFRRLTSVSPHKSFQKRRRLRQMLTLK